MKIELSKAIDHLKFIAKKNGLKLSHSKDYSKAVLLFKISMN